MIELKGLAKRFKKMSSQERLATLRDLLNQWPDYPNGIHRNIIMGGGKFLELPNGARWIKFAIIQGTGEGGSEMMRDIYITADLKKLKNWFLDNAHEIRIHDGELRDERREKYLGKRPPDRGESWFAEGRWMTDCPFCHESHELIATDRFEFPWSEVVSVSNVILEGEDEPYIRRGDRHQDYVDVWKCKGCGYNSVWHQGNAGMTVRFMSKSLKECRKWIMGYWSKIFDLNYTGYPIRFGDFCDAFRTAYDMKSHTKIWKREKKEAERRQKAAEDEIAREKRLLGEGKGAAAGTMERCKEIFEEKEKEASKGQKGHEKKSGIPFEKPDDVGLRG